MQYSKPPFFYIYNRNKIQWVFIYLLFAYNYIHLLHFNSIWIVKENIRYFSNCCCLLFLKWRFFFIIFFFLLLSRNWVLFSEDLDFLSDNFCFLIFFFLLLLFLLREGTFLLNIRVKWRKSNKRYLKHLKHFKWIKVVLMYCV